MKTWLQSEAVAVLKQVQIIKSYFHAARQPVTQLLSNIIRTHPLSKDSLASLRDVWNCLVAIRRYNERLALDAGHVRRISPTQVAVVHLVQFHQHATVDQLVRQLLRLLVRTITDVDSSRTQQVNLQCRILILIFFFFQQFIRQLVGSIQCRPLVVPV